MSFLSRIFGKRVQFIERRYRNAVTAASATGAQTAWSGLNGASGGGGGWQYNEDAANREYLYALGTVQQRAQDLDVNNPDVRGFHRARVAQILGAQVHFRCHPRPEEVGLTPQELAPLCQKIDRLRALHGRLGGFDASGKRRGEGVMQVRAMLTALVLGGCLIHRVWRSEEGVPLPLRVELIPGSRVSTPFDKQGDPLVSFGIQYADEHRSRVTGYWVRRVARTVGNSFVLDTQWDFIPAVDASWLELNEIAGIDRAMPLGVANVRMLRNRGEFMESAVESARAQAGIYAATELAPGDNPFARAMDDADETHDSATPAGFVKLGNGVQMIYCQNGEKINWNSARLPDPDFPGFIDKTDERLARGFSSSLSRFTRRVNSSWAGGRLEDQQDDPIIDQYRDLFRAAWQRVHEWFLEACWLTDAIDLPGYAKDTAKYWSEARVTWPGKLHINPQDTAKARGINFGLRTLTPQQACGEDGLNLEDNLRQWAQALQISRELEKEYGLEEGDLEILLPGKVLSTTAGEDIAPPAPDPEADPTPNKKRGGHKNRIYLNRLQETV